ncbi:hypothetical protein Z045_05870 [Rhodococcus pyridinivorans KG-16]|uniref:Uncharacterized protein n=1 Tax=Rhodococcus pyridinivorans KG-16 TaxID=1441730 RepID=A0A0V9UNW9_9NOCA|nr:hypothetical protein Z045_05870 [Rhodococcus pyridinivorans KG-16]
MIADGGEYINKGKFCVWFRTHNGQTYKFAVASEEFAKEHDLPTHLDITRSDTVPTDKDQAA